MACHNYDGDMLTDEVAQAGNIMGGNIERCRALIAMVRRLNASMNSACSLKAVNFARLRTLLF